MKKKKLYDPDCSWYIGMAPMFGWGELAAFILIPGVITAIMCWLFPEMRH